MKHGEQKLSFHFLFPHLGVIYTRVSTNLRPYRNAITEGVIWKQILIFFFPILFGTFFQQLYNTVDAIIVGQFLGKQALAAVGGGTGIAINLLIGFFVGVSSGSAVIISQYYGAREYDRATEAIHTSIMLAIVAGIGITVLGIAFTRPILTIIGTPDDVMPLAELYMRIFFAGSIFNTVYNMGSGILRALGDSRKPLYFLIAGCLANIVLDVLLVGVFGMGVDGAAIATIASQMISAVLTLISMRRRKDCRLSLRRLAINSRMLKKMMAIGLPTGFQSILYTISNLIIQSHVNGFGTDTAAAWAAYGKLDAVYWMGINAFGIAATTFVGQNYGAGLFDRVRKGIRQSIFMASIMTLALSGLFLAIGKYGLMLFTNDAEVIRIGMEILVLIVPYWITYMPIEMLSGSLRGCGKTLIPTIITVVGICVLRIVWLQIVPSISNTLTSVFLSYPVSWIISSGALIVYYMGRGKSILKDKKDKS